MIYTITFKDSHSYEKWIRENNEIKIISLNTMGNLFNKYLVLTYEKEMKRKEDAKSKISKIEYVRSRERDVCSIRNSDDRQEYDWDVGY